MIILSGTGATLTEPDPTAFSGPTLWIDGTSTSLPGLADLGAVGSTTNWIDRVTSTRNFGQGNSSARPILHQTGGPNEKPYVAFSSGQSVDFSNTIASIIDATAYTGFAVTRPQVNGTNDSAWFCPQLLGTINAFWGISLRSAGGNKFSLWQDRCAPSPRTNSVESTTSYVLDTWYIVEFWWDGTNMRIKVNNDTTAALAYNNVCSLAHTPSIGAHLDLAAMYIWNVDIGSTNRDSFRTDLSNWFGITIP